MPDNLPFADLRIKRLGPEAHLHSSFPFALSLGILLAGPTHAHGEETLQGLGSRGWASRGAFENSACHRLEAESFGLGPMGAWPSLSKRHFGINSGSQPPRMAESTARLLVP